jgi:hypothetical protein
MDEQDQARRVRGDDVTSTLPASGLSADGLSEDQLLHFAEHGWILLEDVLDEAECERYTAALDRTLARLRRPGDDGYETQHHATRNPHLYDPAFLDWYGTPGLLEAYRQLIGRHDIRVWDSLVTTGDPHPQRGERRAELLDPERWGWHRDFDPRWIIVPDLRDPSLIHSTVVVAATFLTPHSPERGVTALLDGSHKQAGEDDETLYGDLKDRCPIVRTTASAGSVVMFTEALLHSAVPVVADERRVAMFTWMCAPWIAGRAEPPYTAQRLVDDDLRSIFRPPTG